MVIDVKLTKLSLKANFILRAFTYIISFKMEFYSNFILILIDELITNH